MLKGLLGNETAEKVLLYLAQYQEGFAKGMADTFQVPVSMIQRQLQRFEADGILVSRKLGGTRLYSWNPRYLFLEEVQAVLKKALTLLPEDMKKKYYRKRTRPRRAGKPL